MEITGRIKPTTDIIFPLPLYFFERTKPVTLNEITITKKGVIIFVTLPVSVPSISKFGNRDKMTGANTSANKKTERINPMIEKTFLGFSCSSATFPYKEV